MNFTKRIAFVAVAALTSTFGAIPSASAEHKSNTNPFANVPDGFFYNHSFTAFYSEPFTHTGVLGTFVGGYGAIYGGWTSGWDTGFGGSNTTGFLGGGVSASVPLADRGTWAARFQGNLFLHGMENPSSSGDNDNSVGVSGQLYAQSITGNAIALDIGMTSARDQFDTSWIGIQHLLNFGHHLFGHYFAIGEIDFYNSSQSPSFWSIGSDLTGFYHDDMVSVGLMTGYGEISDQDRTFTQLGLQTYWKPSRDRNLTLFADAGAIWHRYDNPSISDIDLTYFNFGIRIDLNNIEQGMARNLTLREHRVFNAPFYKAPGLVEHFR